MGDLSGVSFPCQNYVSLQLSTGWTFKQTDDSTNDSWLPVKSIPSTVHQDLIDNKRLEDPFVEFNELKAEWVGTKSWTYRTSFQIPQSFANSRVFLAFEGLDTFATVRLNGKVILESDNMFQQHRVDVTHEVGGEVTNEIQIEFDPALLKAREIVDTYPDHKWRCFNGEPGRLAVRKAQYHWGWDWGPILMCAGIWKPVRLEIFNAKIEDIRTDVRLSEDLQSASIQVTAQVESFNTREMRAKCILSMNGKSISTADVAVSLNGSITTDFTVEQPSLWMPSGYGSQDLYRIDLSIETGSETLHSDSRRFGIRKVELVQEPDIHGKSFFFRINNVDVFCGGSCWIPADSFLTNITPEKYRSWIELLVPANQKMIRIWGGGIYEHDAFYDACDELGILVWQDFMFGCGNYPAFPTILDSIKKEATTNIRRIRHHPSIVIFAGNNEDYQVQEQEGLEYNYTDKCEENWLKTDFPARYIYESLLPKVVAAESPSVPYHPGSPWGDGKISSDPTVGDMHQWNVWHGTQEKYQIFDTLGGRFNSEFGMEAFPHIATIKEFIKNPKDLFAQSHVIDFHNKADGHERRIATYLVENVRTATSLEAYIHLTQLIQCEALMFGYRGWRKQWGESRHCGGALVWQLNDCWPAISWSICDYFLRRKPSYYAMARVLAPVAIGIRREHHDWSVTHAREPKSQNWELWAVSSHLQEIVADVELKFFSVETGKEIKESISIKSLKLQGNGTTEILKGSVDNLGEERHILAARIWVDGKLVARDADWPQPLKYLQYPKRNVKVEVTGDQMHVTADRPVKCLVFEEREGYHLSDSAIDVMPGDKQIILVRGAKTGDAPLDWTYLGAGEQ